MHTVESVQICLIVTHDLKRQRDYGTLFEDKVVRTSRKQQLALHIARDKMVYRALSTHNQ